MDFAPAVLEELERIAPGRVRGNEPMSRHTSFGLGGPADLYVEPASPGAFKDAAAFLHDRGVPVMVLGRGTNLLVRSGGVEGAVMASERAFTRLEHDGTRVTAGGGVALTRLLGYCAERGLAGLEGLAGIPGSVGGAVVTNAASFGVSVGQRLSDVLVFQPGKASARVPSSELVIGYRRTEIPDRAVIEEVGISLEQADAAEVAVRQREVLESKWRTQPVGMRSAGCVFRNPPGQVAGRLIDEAGLKGARVGGAVVSDVHANYILNDRGATPGDVEELIALVRNRVLGHAGVELELEIEIVGRLAN